MVKHMLSILMDGIKDTEMCIDYAEQATDEGSPYANWFKNHAKVRLDALHSDYSYISNEIDLNGKARDGDVIAEALSCHLSHQLKNLNERYARI